MPPSVTRFSRQAPLKVELTPEGELGSLTATTPRVQTVFKWVGEDYTTYNNTHWRVGYPKVADGLSAVLCNEHWLHAFADPFRALLLQPLYNELTDHNRYQLLYKATGVVLLGEADKVGCVWLRLEQLAGGDRPLQGAPDGNLPALSALFRLVIKLLLLLPAVEAFWSGFDTPPAPIQDFLRRLLEEQDYVPSEGTGQTTAYAPRAGQWTCNQRYQRYRELEEEVRGGAPSGRATLWYDFADLLGRFATLENVLVTPNPGLLEREQHYLRRMACYHTRRTAATLIRSCMFQQMTRHAGRLSDPLVVLCQEALPNITPAWFKFLGLPPWGADPIAGTPTAED